MEQHIKDLIDKLTLEEKAALCSGKDFWNLEDIERLGIPSIMVSDGPHGLRKQIEPGDDLDLKESVPATCFPTASALAATWNRDLIKDVGRAIADECRQEKVGVLLGPGSNIKRSPLCGRNFEYFSEDPFQSGEMAAAFIQGVQERGIGTSLKHYAVNNQEHRRLSIDAVVDDRALREIYLAGFERAVKKARPWTVMGSYNRINGTYGCEHPVLLKQILREEWEYEGVAVTDWGALNDRILALETGLDLEMPGSRGVNDEVIVKAARSGQLDEAVLDRSVKRILTMVFRAHETLEEDFSYDRDEHHLLARRVAVETTVLLKNENGILPLDRNVKVALLGDFARNPRYQGAGSSLINPSRLDNLLDEMIAIAGEKNITFAPGYGKVSDDPDDDLIREAVQTSRDADVAVIAAGLPDLFEVEGMDRDQMRLPESHTRLIEEIAAVQERVVVVLSNGSPVEMPWIGRVDAVLEGYLGGQAGAGGLADILYGIMNPSGKLAETFPIRLENTPSCPNFPGGPVTVEYRESLFVGYRFYDTVGKEVLFPFGHGLSYTEYSYGDLRQDRERFTEQDTVTITLKVTNTGKVEGKETVQLYVRPQNSTVFRPKQELKGFEKVSLHPGEEKEVSFSLDGRSFAFFNTKLNDWHIETGVYTIGIGASSRDIRLETEIEVISDHPKAKIPEKDRLEAYRNFPADAVVQDEDFRTLLGRELPSNEIVEGEPYTINTPVCDMTHTFFGRIMARFMQKRGQEYVDNDPESPNSLMMKATMEQAPLRLILLMGGDFNREMIDGLLMIINRKVFRGGVRLLSGIWKKRVLRR